MAMMQMERPKQRTKIIQEDEPDVLCRSKVMEQEESNQHMAKEQVESKQRNVKEEEEFEQRIKEQEELFMVLEQEKVSEQRKVKEQEEFEQRSKEQEESKQRKVKEEEEFEQRKSKQRIKEQEEFILVQEEESEQRKVKEQEESNKRMVKEQEEESTQREVKEEVVCLEKITSPSWVITRQNGEVKLRIKSEPIESSKDIDDHRANAKPSDEFMLEIKSEDQISNGEVKHGIKSETKEPSKHLQEQITIAKPSDALRKAAEPLKYIMENPNSRQEVVGIAEEQEVNAEVLTAFITNALSKIRKVFQKVEKTEEEKSQKVCYDLLKKLHKASLKMNIYTMVREAEKINKIIGK
jgi:hypothetical protein